MHLLSENVKIKIYITIISSILRECGTRSLALQEEHILRVLEKRMLRRICGPRRVEVAGSYRKLHNDRLHNLYSSPNVELSN